MPAGIACGCAGRSVAFGDRSSVPSPLRGPRRWMVFMAESPFEIRPVALQPVSKRIERGFCDRTAKLAFPDRGDPPTCSDKRIAGACVPHDIRGEFALPELRPRGGGGRVATPGMTMPETTMHEDHRPPAAQHQIRAPRQPLHMQTKPEPARMKRPPNDHLRFRVRPADRRHVARSRLRPHHIHE